jgi:hypothetical protein
LKGTSLSDEQSVTEAGWQVQFDFAGRKCQPFSVHPLGHENAQWLGNPGGVVRQNRVKTINHLLTVYEDK